jgi:hypothetical protein
MKAAIAGCTFEDPEEQFENVARFLEAILDGRDKHARQVILNDQFDFGR